MVPLQVEMSVLVGQDPGFRTRVEACPAMILTPDS